MSSLKISYLSPTILTRKSQDELGVENIKTILTILVTFFTDLVQIIKNRNYLGLLGLGGQLLAYGNIVGLAQAAWSEVKDTSLVESNDLSAHFAAELDLDDDEAEELIEYAVNLIPRVYGMILQALTFTADVRGLYEEIRLRFGDSDDDARKVSKISTKANVDKLLKAA